MHFDLKLAKIWLKIDTKILFKGKIVKILGYIWHSFYALYCPILEQCKVSPSPSKYLTNVQKERGEGSKGFWTMLKTAILNITDCPNHQYCHQLINIRHSLQNCDEDWKTFIEDSMLFSFIRKIPNYLHQNHLSKLAQTTFACPYLVGWNTHHLDRWRESYQAPHPHNKMQELELFNLN